MRLHGCFGDLFHPDPNGHFALAPAGMKWRCVALIALALSACAAREVKPTEAEMDRVEAALGREECIGDLKSWLRRYHYKLEFSPEESEAAWKERREPQPTAYNKSVIEVDLREANFEEFGNGRRSYSNYPEGSGGIDDRDYRMAFGTFDVATGLLNLAACGENMAP